MGNGSSRVWPAIALGACLLITACGATVQAQDDKISSNSAKPRNAKHALLIGVSSYSRSNLDSLDGPENDITLMQDVLAKTFDVTSENTTVLVNVRATHTRIKLAFEELARKVATGDFVYIHFSGHGSTAPDTQERRGEDQTWVGYGARSRLDRGLDGYDVLDKELALWLQPIYARTDKVVFVSDSCHSATVAKGERRGVRAAKRDARPHPLAQTIQRIAPPRNGIRIGASRDPESALEIDPITGGACASSKRCNGVFTWYWAQQLRRAHPDETWMEVFERTLALVTTHPGISQRPQLEGTANQRIFGGQFQPTDKAIAVLGVNAGEITLRAGAASAVTRGSVYQLHRGTGSAAEGTLPQLVITSVEPTTSKATARRGTFRAGDLVTELEHAHAFPPLMLYVGGDFEKDQDATLVRSLRASLGKLAGFRLTEDRAAADWWIYVVRDAEKEDRTDPRLPVSSKSAPPVAWVVSADGVLAHPKLRIGLSNAEEGGRVLAENLKLVAWSREVRHLGAQGNFLPVSLQVTVARPDGPRIGPLPLSAAPRQLAPNDLLTFALKNGGDRSLYAYLLAVSPDAAIKRIHPFDVDNEDEARLTQGEDFAVLNGYRLKDTGIESLILVVTETPINPAAFVQQGFRTKGRSPSELEALLAAKWRTKGDLVAPMEEWGAVMTDIEVAK